MNWEYIKQFHLNPPQRREQMPRTSEIDQAYDHHKEEILENGETIGQFILKTIFDTPEKAKQGWQLTLNNYPCNLTEDIDHLLLWIHPSQVLTEREAKDIIEKLLSYRDKYTEWIYYQNLPNVRSIQGVDHYHIFARKS